MKTVKTHKLTVEIPTMAWNRITKKLRDEFMFENPEEDVRRVMAYLLLTTWSDDDSMWMEDHFYPDRETAARAANRLFDKYPGNSPITLKYMIGEIKRAETFVSPRGVARAAARRQKLARVVPFPAPNGNPLDPAQVEVIAKFSRAQHKRLAAAAAVIGRDVTVESLVTAGALSGIDFAASSKADAAEAIAGCVKAYVTEKKTYATPWLGTKHPMQCAR